MKVSIRLKMIVFFLLVIILTGLTATLVGVHLIGDRIVKQAQRKVRLDLNTAREIYKGKTREVETSIRLTALRFFIKNAIIKQDIKSLENELKKISKMESLDFLTLTDKNGTVLLRANNPEFFGDSLADDEFLEKVINKEKIVAATQIFSEKKLLLENEKLPKQARIGLIKTHKQEKD